MPGESENQFSPVPPKSDEGGLTRAALGTRGPRKRILISLVALKGLLCAVGLFCSANIISYAVAHDLASPKRAGFALSAVVGFFALSLVAAVLLEETHVRAAEA